MRPIYILYCILVFWLAVQIPQNFLIGWKILSLYSDFSSGEAIARAYNENELPHGQPVGGN